jgi:hypothetical protein
VVGFSFDLWLYQKPPKIAVILCCCMPPSLFRLGGTFLSRVWLISWVLRGGSIPQHIPPHSHVLAFRQRLTRPACRRPARRSRHIRAVPQPTGVAVQTAAVGPTTWLSTLLSMVSPIPCRGLSPLLNLVMILFRPPRAHRPPGVGDVWLLRKERQTMVRNELDVERLARERERAAVER